MMGDEREKVQVQLKKVASVKVLAALTRLVDMFPSTWEEETKLIRRSVAAVWLFSHLCWR